jgi:hypothetical protein
MGINLSPSKPFYVGAIHVEHPARGGESPLLRPNTKIVLLAVGLFDQQPDDLPNLSVGEEHQQRAKASIIPGERASAGGTT